MDIITQAMVMKYLEEIERARAARIHLGSRTILMYYDVAGESRSFELPLQLFRSGNTVVAQVDELSIAENSDAPSEKTAIMEAMARLMIMFDDRVAELRLSGRLQHAQSLELSSFDLAFLEYAKNCAVLWLPDHADSLMDYYDESIEVTEDSVLITLKPAGKVGDLQNLQFEQAAREADEPVSHTIRLKAQASFGSALVRQNDFNDVRAG